MRPYNRTFFELWMASTKNMFDLFISANHALFSPGGDRDVRGNTPVSDHPSRPDVEPRPDTWHVEVTARDHTDLGVGDRVEFTRTVTEADIDSFAGVSGDTKHLNLHDYQTTTARFGGSPAQGAIAIGLFSVALAHLPGTVVYLSQDLRFNDPVRAGNRLAGTIEIVEDLGDDRYRARTTLENAGVTAIDGEALVLIQNPE